MRLLLLPVWLVVLAALCIVVRPAEAGRRASMPIVGGEYVTLHMGYPGRAIVMWVRWDSDYVTVRQEIQLERYSHTLYHSSQDSTLYSDMVCFGHECVRLEFHRGYSPSETSSESSAPLQLPLVLNNYHGVLGLGPGSPVWRHFRYFQYDLSRLSLGDASMLLSAQAKSQPAVAQQYMPITVQQKHHAEARMWAQLRLDVDYILVPRVVMPDPHKHVHMQFASPLDSGHRWNRFLVDPSSGIRVRDGTEQPLIKVYGSSLVSSQVMVGTERAMVVAALNQDPESGAFNGSDIIVFGRYMLASQFSVFGDSRTQQLSIVKQSGNVVILDEPNQVWPWYFPFAGLLILWIYVKQDSVEFMARLDMTLASGATVMPESPQQYEMMAMTTTPIKDEVSFVMPEQYRWTAPNFPGKMRAAFEQPTTPLSYRNHNFTHWMLLVTTLCCSVFVVSVTFGFGFMENFWRHHFHPYDQAALYGTLWMCVIQLLMAWSMLKLPSTAVINGQNAVLCCVWLLTAMTRRIGGAPLVMVIVAGWAAVFATAQFFDALLGRLWPARSYSGYRTPVRTVLWLALLGVQCAWWCWIFAFYSITSAIQQWSPGSPAMWATGALGMLVVLMSADRLVVRVYDARGSEITKAQRRVLLVLRHDMDKAGIKMDPATAAAADGKKQKQK